MMIMFARKSLKYLEINLSSNCSSCFELGTITEPHSHLLAFEFKLASDYMEGI